ncbi:hypothetical protein ACZ87_01186 [Candidatus Erwinia dacicola]|uniref:Uncharacterized protein n=2 Tax=Candidatus Erwinia dacicola TaxID=252393 RepID=A0A328TT34_9GAMM|nr:hypothetical protein ACZ87_01186 [Candidatus Erwinia dacicola]
MRLCAFADQLSAKTGNIKNMSHQVELNIGSDLQRIRINSTLVGEVIGLILYLPSLVL